MRDEQERYKKRGHPMQALKTQTTRNNRQTKDEWLMHEYHRQDDTLRLESLGIVLSLALFYEDITIE